MKGIFNFRKPIPKYSETWNVNLVLDHLKPLYPLADISFKAHSHKLVMLLALTSGQRCQTLAALDIANMKKTERYYLFGLEEHTKQNRPGSMFSNFCVRRYGHDNLCPYQALETYLERTSVLRGATTTKLFLSYVRPHKAVGNHTIGRWMKVESIQLYLQLIVLARRVLAKLVIAYQPILYLKCLCNEISPQSFIASV